MLKSELRKRFLDKRNQLDEVQWEKLNRQLSDWVLDFINKIPNKGIIASFLPIADKREINTPFIHELVASSGVNITWCFPRVESEGNMHFYQFQSENEIEISAWGIPEPMPIPSQLVRAKDIAIMLIPLITFDQNGHRVGYGKGFYDQYLAKCSPNLLKIGLSIFDEISVIDDLESTDIPLDVIITPTGLSCIGKMSNSY